MNRKEELLAKSRMAKQDEGVEYAEGRGNKIGVMIYAAVAAVLLVFSIPDRTDISGTVAALSFAWVVGGTFSHYRFTKKKSYLVCVIAAAAATIGNMLLVIFPAIR